MADHQPFAGMAKETTLTTLSEKFGTIGQQAMAASAPVVIASNQSAIPVTLPNQTALTYSQAGVITINTDLLVVDCTGFEAVSVQCVSMGTTGVVTPNWSNDGATFVAATLFTVAGSAIATFNSAGIYITPVFARYLRLRLTTATTGGTTTLAVQGITRAANLQVPNQLVTPQASNARIGFVAAHGILYDDSSAALTAGATFTGTSRDLTVGSAAFSSGSTYAKELRVSAESDVTGTLWLETSRDNTNWRRVKSVATTAVTGGGFYAEIIHKPSWRYIRVGYTNGAGAQARFTLNSIVMAG